MQKIKTKKTRTKKMGFFRGSHLLIQNVGFYKKFGLLCEDFHGVYNELKTIKNDKRESNTGV